MGSGGGLVLLGIIGKVIAFLWKKRKKEPTTPQVVINNINNPPQPAESATPALSPPANPNHSFSRAEVLEEQGRWEDAIKFYEKSAEEYADQFGFDCSDRAASLVQAGKLHYQLRCFNSALDCFTEALAISGEGYGFGHAMGHAMVREMIRGCLNELNEGNSDERIKRLKKATAMYDNDTGDVYWEMGDYRTALGFYLNAYLMEDECDEDYHPICITYLANLKSTYAKQQWWWRILPFEKWLLRKMEKHDKKHTSGH